MENATSRSLADRSLALALFLGAALLYVWSSGPGVTAYRDSGEMTVALSTLGVAHAPGYPLYTLAGSVFCRLTPGAMGLRANHFSAVAAAAALAALFLFLRRWCGRGPAFAGALFLAFYRPFWELAAVSEMYALGLLWVVLTMEAGHGRKNPALTGLLFGLGLGVRLDSLVLAPAFFLPFIRDARALATAAGFAVAGATVFLYLPIRSLTEPLLDWGDPETPAALWRTVTRQSYGRGLDLVSSSYRAGENFLSSAVIFGGSIWKYLGPAGAVLAVAGVVVGRNRHHHVWPAILLGFFLSGPVFLYIANMPPNPHAVAIIEAAFLTPALFCCVAAALALERFRTRRYGGAVVAAALVMALANPAASFGEAAKRDAWTLRDYSEALLRSAPRSAVMALREDVQLFGAWHAQLVEKKRPDLSVVGVGLSASDWYWRMTARWPVAGSGRFNLKTRDGFERAVRSSRPVVAGYETDTGEAGVAAAPSGYLRRLTVGAPAPSDARTAWTVSLFRDATTRPAADFFLADLRSDMARALHAHAVEAIPLSRSQAEALFRKAEALDPDFPQPLADRAYLRLTDQRYAEAAELYRRAQALYRDLLARAAYYRSLPDVVASLELGLARALDQEGVSLERSGDIEGARTRYAESIRVRPTAMAHYNLAVTYWNRDWHQAAEHFESAVALDPASTAASRYLDAARKARKL